MFKITDRQLSIVRNPPKTLQITSENDCFRSKITVLLLKVCDLSGLNHIKVNLLI